MCFLVLFCCHDAADPVFQLTALSVLVLVLVPRMLSTLLKKLQYRPTNHAFAFGAFGIIGAFGVHLGSDLASRHIDADATGCRSMKKIA